MIARLRRMLAKRLTMVQVYYAYMLEYRAEIYLWALANTLPFIFMALWITASSENDFGHGPAFFASYFLAVFIVRQYTVVWVIWEFELNVVRGTLSSRLLQPIDPVWRYVAMHVGEKLARTPVAIVIVTVVLLLYPETRWRPQAINVLLAAAVVVLSFTLRFLLQYTLSMLSFWVERAASMETLLFLPYIMLSGMIAPLDVFPAYARIIAFCTPFPYVLYVPVNLLLGRPIGLPFAIPDMLALPFVLLVMLTWIVALFALNRLLWRMGLRRYSAMGA